MHLFYKKKPEEILKEYKEEIEDRILCAVCTVIALVCALFM